MPGALYHYFTPGKTRVGSEADPVARLAGILTVAVVIVAGGYFAFLYLFAGR